MTSLLLTAFCLCFTVFLGGRLAFGDSSDESAPYRIFYEEGTFELGQNAAGCNLPITIPALSRNEVSMLVEKP